jgi:hypothetical protein
MDLTIRSVTDLAQHTKKGALDGKLTLKFLDQTGLSLMLSVANSWFPRGSGRQFKIPTRWGSQGRINLIGTLAVDAQGEHLEARQLTASCTQDVVIAYLDTLAEQSDDAQRRSGTARLTVVILDNASFHRGKAIRAREPIWAAKGCSFDIFQRTAPCSIALKRLGADSKDS